MSVQPMTLEELEKLRQALADYLTLTEFRQAVWELVKDSAYMRWRLNGRLRGMPYVPEDHRGIFQKLGLLDEAGCLRVQMSEWQERRHFLTDTPSVPENIQVFPWLDESMKVTYFAGQLWPGWGQYWIDPMCGPGHHNIIHEGQPRDRISMDVNPRAVAFTRINALINNLQVSTRVRNVHRSLLEVLEEANITYDKQVLVMANAPVVLSPRPNQLLLDSASGETGAALSMAVLEKVRDACARYRNLRLCQLVYTVGDPVANRWHMLDYAWTVFPKRRVEFRLVSGARIWRVSGVKCESNPMPLAKLRRQAECMLQLRGNKEEREQLAQDYDNLAARLKERYGATHLACGILAVDVT